MQRGKKFLSELKLHSDYFKWQEDKNRYETWEEAIESIIDGHKQKYTDKINELTPYFDSIRESMISKTVLASQRNLQFRYPQIKTSNARIYNCSSMHCVRNKVFQDVFYLGLNGCGVGVSLLLPFVSKLSNIKKRENGTKTYIIDDSIAGWADALGVLLSSYFVDNQPFPEYAGYKIRFDYSLIRPKGSKISGGFKAPGYEGLQHSLENIEKLIGNWLETEGNVIRPILAFDIFCITADSILSGGVRRSALNMLVDPNDNEMIYAKTGNWRQTHPHRARSNNSVLLRRKNVKKEQFEEIVNLNDGDSDIGFAFVNSFFDMYNPCFEISKLPILTEEDLSLIEYDQLDDFINRNIDNFGVAFCNLTEINAENCNTKDKFLKACKDASILGTLQAGYTDFPYLGEVTEKIVKREALLGVSITGWMNNPKLFDAELLKEGANVVKQVNKEIAAIIDINPAARTTTCKPSGNASVILGTASGIHPEHSERYFRIMQLNKESNTAKWLKDNMDFLLEESVWSATNSDYVVFVPVENPKVGLFKKDMKGIKHLELIKLVQENWVREGTNDDLCLYRGISHNVSNTVIIDNKEEMIEYIYANRDLFNAVSFLSDYGDKDFNQAPFTSVLTLDELVEQYGKATVFASGLIVDGLHYFDNNLWLACDLVLDVEEKNPIIGTREQVMLRKYWIKRAKKFARNYFKNDVKKMVYCLKDVHLFHKWDTINRQFKDVDFSKILEKPEFKDINEFAAVACSGGMCEITKI